MNGLGYLIDDSLALVAKALSLGKSITTGTGLVGIDLQAPAKNLYPVLTPLRNSIPRTPGETGLSTQWRQVDDRWSMTMTIRS